MDNCISIKNVSFKYDELNDFILRDVNINIKKGECFYIKYIISSIKKEKLYMLIRLVLRIERIF